MHNPTGATQSRPNHTSPTPRIYHRLINGTHHIWCGITLANPTIVPGPEAKSLPPSEACPRCVAARKLNRELTAHLEENAKLPLTAFELLARLDNGDMD